MAKVNAHTQYILDMQWSPFKDNLLCTCSEDGSIRVWEFKNSGIFSDVQMSDSVCSIEYHERKCTQVVWHPVASNVLMSVSQDPKICIWNLDYGECEVESQDITEPVWFAAWNQRGDMVVTASKDKKIRIYEARTLNQLIECNGRDSSKAMRAIFIQGDTRLLTTGFDRSSQRQYSIYEINRKGDEIESINRLDQWELDNANGV
jgi:WD40 repeat protein